MKLVKYCLYLLLSTSSPFFVWSQGTITGNVQDVRHESLPGVNVLLLDLKDTTMIKGNTADLEGRFSIADVPYGHYLVLFSFIGHEKKYLGPFEISATLPQKNLKDVVIEPEAVELSTVTVKASKPFLEQKIDRLIVNVASSITAAGGTMADILQKIPGVIIINDQIRLNGRQGVAIYIDGRPTGHVDMASLLKDMPTQNIERIEVINNPGAKFDAAGSNGIINVVLKKNADLGTQGVVNVGAGYGRFGKGNLGLTLNHRQGKINLFGSAATTARKSYEVNNLTRWVGADRFDQESYRPYQSQGLSYRLGTDWFLHPKHVLGVLISGNSSSSNSNQISNTAVSQAETLPFLDFEAVNQANKNWQNFNSNLNYKFNIDTSGQEFAVDIDRSTYRQSAQTTQQTTSLIGTLDNSALLPFRNLQPAGTQIITLKMDYTKPFAKNTSFEAGFKSAWVEIDSDSRFEQEIENKWVDDKSRSNHFIYHEQIQALYGNFKHKFKWFDAQIGLRAERTVVEGTNLSNGQVLTRRNYTRLFPSIFLSRPVVDQLVAHLSYSRRIDRPNFQDLNPFVVFLDPFTYRRGNPLLAPQFTDSYKFRLTYANQPFFSVGYNLIHDPINMVTEQDDSTKISYAYQANLGKRKNFDISVYFPIKAGKVLSGIGGVNAFYNEFESVFLNERYNAKRWSANYFLQLSLKFQNNLSFEATSWFQMAGLDGLMAYRSLYGCDLGAQKTFNDGRTKLRITYNNPIFKYWTGTTKFQNMNLTVNNQWETQILRLQFTQTFGNNVLKESRRRSTGTEDERKRIKTE